MFRTRDPVKSLMCEKINRYIKLYMGQDGVQSKDFEKWPERRNHTRISPMGTDDCEGARIISECTAKLIDEMHDTIASTDY